MYFATKDIEGLNIQVKQGFALPLNWQSVSMVRALHQKFGPCTLHLKHEEICLDRLLDKESEGDKKDECKKNLGDGAQRRRSGSNRANKPGR